MKRLFTTGLLTALIAVATSYGAPRTPRQALDIARDFESGVTVGSMKRVASDRASLRQAYLHSDQVSGLQTVYVFNRGDADGYVLVSGDDRAPAILGYADNGSFDATTIPDNMKAMLDDWSRQIAWLATHSEARAVSPAPPARTIEPLLGEISWDQGAPYNTKCPTVTQANVWGGDAGKGPAATGCVATALGQIMYYHKWPERGMGEVSYTSEGTTPSGNPEKLPVSVTFEGTEYNWDAMQPSLSSSSPSDAIDAVSTLLYHVGASFESIYGASTGATDVSVAPALMRHFGYDKGINYVKRDYFTALDWHNLLINELENGRPVAYGGITRRAGGHFFVLDGVNTEGYYHVNWGWGGNQNGYYLITLLEPGAQGIGGADGGAYHYEQNMIIGIRPPVEGSSLNYNFSCKGVNALEKTVGRRESVTLTANGIYNDSPNEVTASLGFFLIDSEGNVVLRKMVVEEEDYGIAYGERSLSCSFVIPDNIPAGQYTIRPGYQISADNYATDRFIQMIPGRPSQYSVTITDSNIKYTTQGAFALTLLEVSGDNDGYLENGVTKQVTLKVRNDGGEFNGRVQLRMFINGQEFTFGRFNFPEKELQGKRVSVPAYSEMDITFDVGDFNIPGHDDYVVRLWGNESILQFDSETGQPYEPDAKNLCSVSGIKVIGPALPPVLAIEDDIIMTTKSDGVVPRNDVGMKVCLTNEGGTWTGRLRCAVWDNETWTSKPIGYVDFPHEVTIDGATEEQWISLVGGEMPDVCEVGHKYDIVLQDPVEKQAMIPSKYVTVTITLGEAVDKTSILSLTDECVIPEVINRDEETRFVFGVRNTGFRFDSTLRFVILLEDAEMFVSSPQTLVLDRDEEDTVSFTETISLEESSAYVIRLQSDDQTIGEFTGIAVKGTSGITDADTDSIRILADRGTVIVSGTDPLSITAFSADGRIAAHADGTDRLDISSLRPGAYILLVKTCESVRTLKFIK